MAGDDAKRVFRATPDGTAVAEEKTAAQDGKGPDLTERTVREMTFSTHIISLNAMAMMYMGQLGEGEVDKDGAQHMIDTLAMLREKTQGNLTADESRLLDSLLYDLRLKYVGLP
jgi:hypothetical protein